MLCITPRHCSRLLERYRQLGPLGMNNQSRGRTGNRQLPASLTELALGLIRITTDALQKPPGMTLMFTGHLKLMMIWPHLSHGGSRAVFQNP